MAMKVSDLFSLNFQIRCGIFSLFIIYSLFVFSRCFHFQIHISSFPNEISLNFHENFLEAPNILCWMNETFSETFIPMAFYIDTFNDIS